eukprot:1018468-Amphidinium_carterae.1
MILQSPELALRLQPHMVPGHASSFHLGHARASGPMRAPLPPPQHRADASGTSVKRRRVSVAAK